MSSIETYINHLLKTIPASSEDIYDWFASQRMSFHQRKTWGFPIQDLQCPEKVCLLAHRPFPNPKDPKEQVCRCGKLVSLLKDDWYIDDDGCCYHWGKKTYSDGPDSGFYDCCKETSKKNGCVHSKYHACAYKPIESSSFVQAKQTIFKKRDSTNIFALDSEMVYTTAGLEVARVTLLSIKGETVVDLYVQPQNLIIDYNTPFSGIKAEDLDGVKTTLSDAQELILKVLNRDSILVGHGLENDLLAVHLMHENIVDTSTVYRHEKGFPLRHSLKTLSLKYLHKVIHSDTSGHDSVEDARICIALMLQKLHLQSQNPYFNYSGSNVYTLPPHVQQNVRFIVPQTFFPNFTVKPIPFLTGQTIIIPKIWSIAPIIPMILPNRLIYPPAPQFMFH